MRERADEIFHGRSIAHLVADFFQYMKRVIIGGLLLLLAIILMMRERGHQSTSGSKPIAGVLPPAFRDRYQMRIRHRAMVAKWLREWKRDGFNLVKIQECLDLLQPEDFPGLLDEYRQYAGMVAKEGMSPTMVERVWGMLFAHWYTMQPEQSLAWMDQENTWLKQCGLEELMASLGGKNLDAALALTLRFPEERQQMLRCLHAYALASGEKRYLLFLRESIMKVDEPLRVCFTFPEKGFDFRRVLDGMKEIQASLKAGEQMAVVPENFMEEWAKHDPQAVWDLYGQDLPVPKVTASQLLAMPGMTDEQRGKFLARQYDAAHEDRLPELISHALVPDGMNCEVAIDFGFLSSYLDSLPGNRRQHLEALYDQVAEYKGLGMLYYLGALLTADVTKPEDLKPMVDRLSERLSKDGKTTSSEVMDFLLGLSYDHKGYSADQLRTVFPLEKEEAAH